LLSKKVQKRYPNYQSLINQGILKRSEATALKKAEKMNKMDIAWMPNFWAVNVLRKAEAAQMLDSVAFTGLVRSIEDIERANR